MVLMLYLRLNNPLAYALTDRKHSGSEMTWQTALRHVIRDTKVMITAVKLHLLFANNSNDSGLIAQDDHG